MIPRLDARSQGWLDGVLEALRHAGAAVVTGVVGHELLQATRAALYRARDAVEREVGSARLQAAGELGVVRIPMRSEPTFFRYLELPEVLAVVDATVSPTAVLHLQNGLVLPAAPDAAPRDLFQLRFHMDFPRVLNGYLCSVNTLFAIDEFTAENGGTLVVPESHQAAEPPSRAQLETRALGVECPAGSMLVFDSTLWHAAGSNRSDRDRLALNQQFTRSYFKPQIDYVRALGDAAVLARPPRAQQLLGWYTRVVTSLDEYYRPAEERLYRGGQG